MTVERRLGPVGGRTRPVDLPGGVEVQSCRLAEALAQRFKHYAQMKSTIVEQCSVVDEKGHCLKGLICDRIVRARLDAALYNTAIV